MHFLHMAIDFFMGAALLIPIGVFGLFRWLMWLAKRIPALFYRPIENDYECSATIVTPVYNENPALFCKAIESWIANRPDRIIAVVDVTDTTCMAIARAYPEVDVIPIDIPGKRPALAAGVDAATTDIVVLVDSDVIWEPDVLRKLKMPFADATIGGVGTRQQMYPSDGQRPTVWERLADIYLAIRYSDEVPATTRWGRAVSCLSGRTAAYRTKLLQSMREAFLNETFLGLPCLSGDDKRYTCLVLQRGYRTWNQLHACVYSTFKPDFAGFVKQRLRWSRNSFRSDLRALWQGWVWRYPYLAIMLIDKTVAPFTLLLGPIVLAVAIAVGKWDLVAALLVWWFLSRSFKILPHLRRRPADWLIVPLFILITYYMSLVKTYALCTLNEHRWLTRAVALGLICMLMIGLPPATAAPAARHAQPPQGGGDGDIPPGRPASWDVVDDPRAIPPADGATSRPESAAAAPTDCLGAPTRQIRYTSDGVIHLEGCGQLFTLTQVAADSHVGPSKLQLVDAPNKIWLLKTKLKIEEGATLKVTGGPAGDANWLRLRSDPSSAIWLRGEQGNLLLQDSRVTSWDTTRNTFDTDVSVAADGTGGRAYIAVRSVLTKGRPTAPPTACSANGGSQEYYEARMDVVNSEIAYLGYDNAESYGIVWKVYYKVDTTDPSDQPPPGRQLYALVDIFGDVHASTFDHNYFGSYTFGAYCMSWSQNTFEQNLQYGLDPHDDSDYLTITGNTFRDNGNHGVICSVECNNLVIANNQSYRNLHGIMVHRNSNGALVEGNSVYDNRQAGIAIFDSHDAVVRNNTVTNNAESAVRLSVGSSGNLIENNKLTGLAASGTGSGYVIYTYKGSDAPTSGDGLPKNNIFRNNQLTGYKSLLLQINDATSNLFEANTVGGALNTSAFNRSAGNTIRNGEVGKTIQVTLGTTSTLTLQDSRNDVWMLSRSGLSTAAGATGTTLSLNYANTGGSVAVTTLDLAVRPPNGTIAVQPTSWQAGSKRWTEYSNDTSGAVTHSVGGLQGGCYDVTANRAAIGRFSADNTGRISFSYSGGYGGTVAFVVAKAAACAGAVPSYKVLLPLVRQ